MDQILKELEAALKPLYKGETIRIRRSGGWDSDDWDITVERSMLPSRILSIFPPVNVKSICKIVGVGEGGRKYHVYIRDQTAKATIGPILGRYQRMFTFSFQ